VSVDKRERSETGREGLREGGRERCHGPVPWIRSYRRQEDSAAGFQELDHIPSFSLFPSWKALGGTHPVQAPLLALFCYHGVFIACQCWLALANMISLVEMQGAMRGIAEEGR